MAIKIGNTEISTIGKIKIGTSNVQKVYVGSDLVWPPSASPVRFLKVTNQSNVPLVVSATLKITGQSDVFVFQAAENCISYSNQKNFAFVSASSMILNWTIGPTTNLITGVYSWQVIRDDTNAVIYSGSYNYNNRNDGQIGSFSQSITEGIGYRVLFTFIESFCQIL